MNPSHPNNSIEVEQPAQEAPDLPPVGPDTPAPASTELNQPLFEPDAPLERLEEPRSDPSEAEIGEGDNAGDGEWPSGSPSMRKGAPDLLIIQHPINTACLDRPV